MDIEYLREYLTVAGELNLTKAARLLSTTQSTLSKHVAALEREFGSELIRRSGKMVELTQAGSLLFRRARTIVGEFDAAKSELKRLAETTPARVGGMLQNSEVVNMLSKTMALARERDETRAAFVTSTAKPFFERLEKGDLDVVLCHGGYVEPPSSVASRKLLTVPFTLVVEHGHPLTQHDSVTLVECADYPFVQLVGDYAQTGWGSIASACRRCGFEPRKYPVVANNPIDCISEPLGDALLILTDQLFPGGKQTFSMRGLATVPVNDPYAHFDLYTYYRSVDERRLSPFLDLLSEAAHLEQDIIDHPASTSSKPFRTRCELLANDKGLNESELQAMTAFAKGRSVDRIAEKMGLTRLIVGDLLASVYQKLGIRDKQELLDAIEAVRLP